MECLSFARLWVIKREGLCMQIEAVGLLCSIEGIAQNGIVQSLLMGTSNWWVRPVWGMSRMRRWPKA